MHEDSNISGTSISKKMENDYHKRMTLHWEITMYLLLFTSAHLTKCINFIFDRESRILKKDPGVSSLLLAIFNFNDY